MRKDKYSSSDKDEVKVKKNKYSSSDKDEVKVKKNKYSSSDKGEVKVKKNKYSSSDKDEVKMKKNKYSSLSKNKTKIESAHQECIDRAYRIPIFLSTTTHLNDNQQRFLDRLILEIENALLFPRTLPLSESYPESILTDIRRLVSSSYGMLAVNLRRFKIQTVDVNTGPPPPSTPFWVGSVYSQVEPSMAFQFGLPLLLVREEDTDANNGIWAGGIAPLNLFIVWHSETQTVDEFFNTPEWKSAFANWSAQVRNAFYIQTKPNFKYSCE